jgi:hypothetical protein
MPKGMPSTTSANAPQPLRLDRLENAPLVSVGAFRMRRTRKRKDKQGNETGEEYEVDNVVLSLDFDSGHTQHNADGEAILDDDGNEKPHLINLGYVTLTGNSRGNLIDIVKALGFKGPDFIEEEGGNAGGLRDDLDIIMEFGTNGLGHDYTGKEYEDLPEYDFNDKEGPRKRKIEVPVVSWTINGYQVIGRRLDMALEVKNGYDKPTAFLAPRDPEPLRPADWAAAQQVLPYGKPVAAPAQATASGEPEPPKPKHKDDKLAKARRWVWDTMDELLVPVEYRTPIMRAFAAEPSIKNIASLDAESCRNLRDAYKEDPSIIKQLYELVSGEAEPEAEDDDPDEF